jgi:hypothetical protein
VGGNRLKRRRGIDGCFLAMRMLGRRNKSRVASADLPSQKIGRIAEFRCRRFDASRSPPTPTTTASTRENVGDVQSFILCLRMVCLHSSHFPSTPCMPSIPPKDEGIVSQPCGLCPRFYFRPGFGLVRIREASSRHLAACRIDAPRCVVQYAPDPIIPG